MARRTPYNMLLEPPRLVKVEAARTALIVIDAQRYATSRDHGLGLAARERAITREFNEYYQMAEAAIGNTARLLATARARGATVMHTVLADRGPGSVSRQLSVARVPLPTGDAAADIRGEVAPASQEPVLARGAYGIFATTDLEARLQRANIERVVLCGMLANVTVALAAREAADRGFGVVVAQDCCASETLDWHTVTMLGLNGGLIRVQWCDEVIEMLEGTRT